MLGFTVSTAIKHYPSGNQTTHTIITDNAISNK